MRFINWACDPHRWTRIASGVGTGYALMAVSDYIAGVTGACYLTIFDSVAWYSMALWTHDRMTRQHKG